MDASTLISERVQLLKTTFEDHQKLVDDSIRILNNTSASLQGVCRNYDPVRKQAENLETTLKNTQDTRGIVKGILEDVQVSRELEAFIQTTNLDNNLGHVLATMARVSQATEFFTKNKNLDISEDAIQQGRLTLAEAYHKCGTLLQRLIKNSIKVPSKIELEDIMRQSRPERPAALAVYLSSDILPLQQMYKVIKAMRDAGRTECIQIYTGVRTECLQSMMRSMGMLVDHTSVMSSGVATDKFVSEWVQAMRALAQAVDWEEQLSKQLFGSAADQVLAGIVKGAVDSMIATGNELAGGRQVPEKLFPVLDMIGCLRSSDLMPLFDKSDSVQAQLARLLTTLKAATQGLSDIFLAAVTNDQSMLPKDLTAATTVAPQTAFAMRFLKHLYKEQVAEQLMYVDRSSQLAKHTVLQLESNLASKVALFIKDKPASAIALLNNTNYIHKSVVQQELLQTALGPEWLESHSQSMRAMQKEYFMSTWDPILVILKSACAENTSNVKKDTVKDYFKKLNARIEKLHSVQSFWSIPDNELKSKLHDSIVQNILPKYKNFWTMYIALSALKKPDKHFKYDPIELEDMIRTDFFAANRPRARPSLASNSRLLAHV